MTKTYKVTTTAAWYGDTEHLVTVPDNARCHMSDYEGRRSVQFTTELDKYETTVLAQFAGPKSVVLQDTDLVTVVTTEPEEPQPTNLAEIAEGVAQESQVKADSE